MTRRAQQGYINVISSAGRTEKTYMVMAINTLEFIYPDWPAPVHVKALTTTRDGGFSVGPYSSFNLSNGVRDTDGGLSAGIPVRPAQHAHCSIACRLARVGRRCRRGGLAQDPASAGQSAGLARAGHRTVRLRGRRRRAQNVCQSGQRDGRVVHSRAQSSGTLAGRSLRYRASASALTGRARDLWRPALHAARTRSVLFPPARWRLRTHGLAHLAG